MSNDMAQAIPSRRRVLCFGQVGDWPDELIRQMPHSTGRNRALGAQ